MMCQLVALSLVGGELKRVFPALGEFVSGRNHVEVDYLGISEKNRYCRFHVVCIVAHSASVPVEASSSLDCPGDVANHRRKLSSKQTVLPLRLFRGKVFTE